MNRRHPQERIIAVLQALADGLVVKQIATKLGIKDRQVTSICENMFRKTGIRTSPGIVAYAIRNGMIT